MTTTTPILYLGKDIRDSRNDRLEACSFDDFIQQLREPEEALLGLTHRLRKVRALDQGAYQGLKTNLPYFIMSSFRNDIRNQHNFQSVHGFAIDIDGIQELEDAAHGTLKAKLAADPRAMAVYTTPSGAGLKVLFSLVEPCENTSMFTAFYKVFADAFAARHELQGKVDRKTNDASRVHFYCADPDIRVNTLYEKVDMQEWLNRADIMTRPQSELPQDQAGPPAEAPKGSPVDYQSILEKLGGAKPNKPAREYFVPDAVYRMEPAIHKALEAHDISVLEVRPIQYGLKFIGLHAGNQGEVNVFAGKRGYSVVRSPRNGTNPGLNDVMHGLITRLLFSGAALTETQEQVESPIF